MNNTNIIDYVLHVTYVGSNNCRSSIVAQTILAQTIVAPGQWFYCPFCHRLFRLLFTGTESNPLGCLFLPITVFEHHLQVFNGIMYTHTYISIQRNLFVATRRLGAKGRFASLKLSMSPCFAAQALQMLHRRCKYASQGCTGAANASICKKSAARAR